MFHYLTPDTHPLALRAITSVSNGTVNPIFKFSFKCLPIQISDHEKTDNESHKSTDNGGNTPQRKIIVHHLHLPLPCRTNQGNDTLSNFSPKTPNYRGRPRNITFTDHCPTFKCQCLLVVEGKNQEYNSEALCLLLHNVIKETAGPTST